MKLRGKRRVIVMRFAGGHDPIELLSAARGGASVHFRLRQHTQETRYPHGCAAFQQACHRRDPLLRKERYGIPQWKPRLPGSQLFAPLHRAI
jgi:hypothetical protein